MIFSALKTFCRLSVPSLKGSKVSDTYLETLIKAGVRLVAEETNCLPSEKVIGTSASEGTYSISTEIDDFIEIDESGIYYNTGTDSSIDWTQLIPKTKKWLDENLGDWRNASAGTPMYYAVEEDSIILYPKPDTTLENGFKVYYFRYPQEMTNDSDYPFEGATKIPHLEILDECIISYAKWKSTPFVGDPQLENPYEAEFYREISRKRNRIKSRKDISSYTSSNRNNLRMRLKRA